MKALFILLILLASQAFAQGQVETKAKREAQKASSSEDAGRLAPGAPSNNQQQIWESNVQMNPKSEVAWESLYMTNRRQAVSKYNKVPSVSSQKHLDSIMAEMGKNIEASYTYHYLKFVNDGYADFNSAALKKAYNLSSNKSELYDELVAMHLINGKTQESVEILKKIKSSAKYSSFKYEYAKNTLESVSPNGVLIVNGEVDTYPILYLQLVQGVRKDVHVINLDLARNKSYWTSFSSTAGLRGNYNANDVSFVKGLLQNNPSKSIHLAMTVNPSVLKNIQSKLYACGLTFIYSNSASNNIDLTQKAAEKQDFQKLKEKNKSSEDKKLSNNYLFMTSLLYDYYKTSDKSKAKMYKSLAKSIAEENGIWAKIASKYE